MGVLLFPRFQMPVMVVPRYRIALLPLKHRVCWGLTSICGAAKRPLALKAGCCALSGMWYNHL